MTECKKSITKLVDIVWLSTNDALPNVLISAGLSNGAFNTTYAFAGKFAGANFGVVKYSEFTKQMQDIIYATFCDEMLNAAIDNFCDILAKAIIVAIKSQKIYEISIVAKSFGAAVMHHLVTQPGLNIAFMSIKAPSYTAAFGKPHRCKHLALHWSYDDKRIPITKRSAIIDLLEKTNQPFDCYVQRTGGHEFSSDMIKKLQEKLSDCESIFKHANINWVKKFVDNYTTNSGSVVDAHILLNEYLVYVPVMEKFAQISKNNAMIEYAKKCKLAGRYFNITPAVISEEEINAKIALGGNADDIFGNKNIIIWAIETGDSALALRMIKLFPEMTSVAGLFGDTPLAHAVIMSMTKVVQALLDIGVNVNTKVAFGNTVLHWAYVVGNKEVIDLLRRAKTIIDANLKDDINADINIPINDFGLAAISYGE